MAERRVLELTLESLSLPAAVTGGRAGRRGLLVNLVWPRPSIAERSAFTAFTVDASGERDLRALPWGRRILFKEIVEGPFALEINLTASLSSREWQSLLDRMSGALLDGIVRIAPRWPEGGWPAMAGVPFTLAARELKKVALPDPRLLARGNWEHDGKEPGPEQLAVGLRATEALYRQTTERERGNRVRRRRKVMEAGETAGKVTLGVRLTKR